MRRPRCDRGSLIPPAIDAVLAAGFTALAVVEAVTRGWDVGTLLVPSMAALAWRRVWPTAVALVVLVAGMLADPDGQTTGVLGMAVATYTVGSVLPPRRAVESIAAVGGLAWVAGLGTHFYLRPSDVAAMVVFWIGPFLVGMAHRRSTARLVAVREQLARAEERRVIEAEQAVARERARIARELHDVVSHSLTVVTINAQAVRRSLPEQSGRAVDALRAIEATARDATAEMRRLFAVLRESGTSEPLHPQPDLGQLAGLVERMAEAGLPVSLDVEEGLRAPAGLAVTVYRIVQEALTNVLRHAHAGAAWVRVARSGQDLVVEVEDDGVGDRRGPGPAGHGLVGIQERARLYDGDASFGAGERGFRVRVRLPAESAR